MKALKTLLLSILSIAFVLSALFMQINLALNCTVFSSGYFNWTLDRNVKRADMNRLAAGLADSTEAFLPQMKSAIDGKWLAKEAPAMAKGVFAFLTGSAKSLPSVGIAPVKDAMVDTYVEQYLAGSGGSPKEFDTLIAQIELTSGGFVRGGKVNAAAVQQFMQMGRMMGMTMAKKTAEDICLKIGNRDRDNATIEELYEYTVKAVAADMLGVEDKLNLGVLVNSAYGTKTNPVTGFPVMFGGIRTDVLLLSALVFVLLLGAIAAVAHRPAEICRWAGVPLIVSGVLGLALPVLTLLLRPQIAGAFKGAGAAAQFLTNWALSYAGGITVFLFALCLVCVGLGWALTALARRMDSGKRAARASRNGLLRTAVAVILIAAIPFSAMLIGKDVLRRADDYDRIVKAAARQKNIDFGKALMEALGVDGR